MADGGIGKAWAATGAAHFEIREIDYAEVLRERAAAAGGAEWDRIIAFCLQGDTAPLDERTLEAVIGALGDPERFGELLDGCSRSRTGAASMGARAAALLGLIRKAHRSG